MSEPTQDKSTQKIDLPDFRPKGMSTIDKVFAWLLAFIVIGFLMQTATHYLNSREPAKPVARPAASAPASPASPSSGGGPYEYVVVNTASGYVWWLDNGGVNFTPATAKTFIVGHRTYKVFALSLHA
jgi:hypothetical protein